jgi:hypothetical protein
VILGAIYGLISIFKNFNFKLKTPTTMKTKKANKTANIVSFRETIGFIGSNASILGLAAVPGR